MQIEFLAFLALGALSGGFINGLAGFGFALFSLGWWLQVMPPVQAVAMSMALSVLSGIQGVWLVRREIRPRRLALFLGPALIGIPIGLLLLDRVNADQLKLVIAGFLMLYGGFFTFRKELPRLEAGPAADGAVGFLGGVLGGVAGLSGALPTMWLALRDWPKAESRAALQPYNVSVLALSAVLLAFSGAYTGEVLTRLAIAAPLALIAAQVGLAIYKRLPDAVFRRLLIALMFVAGGALFLRTI